MGVQEEAERRRKEKFDNFSSKKIVPSKEDKTKASPIKLTPAMRNIAKKKVEGQKPSHLEEVLRHSDPVGSSSPSPSPSGITVNINT